VLVHIVRVLVGVESKVCMPIDVDGRVRAGVRAHDRVRVHVSVRVRCRAGREVPQMRMTAPVVVVAFVVVRGRVGEVERGVEGEGGVGGTDTGTVTGS
jgi:hypothetical protein